MKSFWNAVANLAPNNKNSVKVLLLASSPYLSQSLLQELALKAPGYFPYSWLKEVVVANSDVIRQEGFMDFITTMPSPVPPGQVNHINNAIGTITERTEKEHSIVSINRDRNRIANLIIKDVSLDTNGINSTKYNEWIIKRGDYLCELQLADFQISRGEKTLCSARIDNIDLIISQLTQSEIKEELEFYSAFKKRMLLLSNSRGVLEGLDDPLTESTVRNFAENAHGYSQVQAQNLLCFFLGECETAPIPQFQSGARLNSQEDGQNLDEIDVSHLSLYPNPTTGIVVLKLDVDSEPFTIHVINIEGKLMMELITMDQELNLDLSEFDNGVYQVIVIDGEGGRHTQKLIKQ
jgi:hypothetical protein